MLGGEYNSRSVAHFFWLECSRMYLEAMGKALDAVTAQNAQGFFAHCGYYI